MKRVLLLAFLMWSSFASAQTALPIFLGQNQSMLPPTVDRSGRTLVFGSAISSDGTNLGKTDLYTVTSDGGVIRRLTNLPGTVGSYPPPGAIFVSFSANAARAAFTVAGSTSTTTPPTTGPFEEVHVVDVATGTDRVAAVDKEGCILPLADALCISCFLTCIYGPHINSDGSKVLYSARRNQPFYVANSDGSSVARLPVYTGSIAPSAQRVISRNGLVVFTSSAPFGPTFAASSTDVIVMNLDGTNIQNVTKFGGDAAIYSSNATISADGSTIAFESNSAPSVVVGSTNSTTQPTQIWTVHTDGTGLRAVTTGTDACLQPSISGDGSLVAFVRNGQIGTVRPDGSNLRILTKLQMSTARDPVISEDGSVIVFDIGPPTGRIGALYAINSDGTNLHVVYAPRALNQSGITGLTYGAAPSPGSLFSAYGLNFFTDSVTVAANFPLPTVLGGLSLLVNGRPAPLLAVSPWQINAQLAADVLQGPAAFQLKFADGATPSPAAADVKNVAPAIFILASPGNVAPAQAAAFHTNTSVPADATHPAVAGEILEIYGTGLGVTTPPVAAGTPAPSSPPARTLNTPQVFFGNTQAQVDFVGLTPGLAGVYQVNVRVPAGLRPGTQTVQWRIDSTTTSNAGTITVQ